MRVCQLTGRDPEEIIVPFTNSEIALLWTENRHWQKSFEGEELTTKTPKQTSNFSLSKELIEFFLV